MIKGFIEVNNKIKEIAKNNPFYGQITSEECYRHTITMDKNEVVTPPFGVYATIKFDNGLEMEIKISKHYFEFLEDHEDGKWFNAFFELNGNVYGIIVKFRDGLIDNFTMDVWYDKCAFEDGEDSDAFYDFDDFDNIEKYEL